jgi:hypothetical protein
MAMDYNLWNGLCGDISGSTPFGFYDDNEEFQIAGPKTAKFCARKLGYPIVDIELQSGSFFACFEESISEYGAQVNQYNIKDNLLSVRGTPVSSNLTHKNVAGNLGPLVRLAEGYGTEAGLFSNVTWKTGSIDITTDTQLYDIDTLFTNVQESGSHISIQKIHHYAPPALARFFDPYAGTGMGTYSTMAEFGFDSMSPAASFLMMPIFEDILRLQAIEFNDQIRRSSYGFQLYNNQLRIFPKPTSNFTLHFEYFVEEERDDVGNIYSANTMSDLSNVTYDNMVYSNINDVGKQWIRSYTLALSKELLGHIRSKYQSIPVPGSEISLDGSDLISSAQDEKTKLMEQLREILEQTSKATMMEQKAAESENLENTLRRVPAKIYLG